MTKPAMKRNGKLNLWAPWMKRAACKIIDPDIFHPWRYNKRHVEPAKEICARCCVQTECLEYALFHEIGSGIWGHTTPGERKRIQIEREHGEAV